MLRHFRRLIIAPAGSGPFEDLVLALEVIILALELLKLFTVGLRKLFDQRESTVCTALRNNADEVLSNVTSLRTLQSSRTIGALGTELLRQHNSVVAEDAAPELQFTTGL